LNEDGQHLVEGLPGLELRIQELEAHRDSVCNAIKQSADKQAYQYDKGHRPPNLEVGDEVLINPHSLELVDIKKGSRKLIQREIGPFEIMEVISPAAFWLRLPDSYPMHNVVNLQHLTRYQRSPDKDRLSLANPRDSLQESEEYEVEKIVGEQRRKGKVLYRVQWKGYSAEDDTWQTAKDLRNTPELLKQWKLQL
jgi:hypothetical protein